MVGQTTSDRISDKIKSFLAFGSFKRIKWHESLKKLMIFEVSTGLIKKMLPNINKMSQILIYLIPNLLLRLILCLLILLSLLLWLLLWRWPWFWHFVQQILDFFLFVIRSPQFIETKDGFRNFLYFFHIDIDFGKPWFHIFLKDNTAIQPENKKNQHNNCKSNFRSGFLCVWYLPSKLQTSDRNHIRCIE